MKTKVRTIILTVILLIVAILCVLWAGLTVCGIDVISEAKSLLNMDQSAKSVAFKNEKVTLGVGQKSDLNLVMEPATTKSTFTFTSSDESVVKASGNEAEAVGDGECTIKVKTDNNLTDYCEVTVISAPKSVSVPKQIKISLNENYTITPNAKDKCPDSFFTFSSNNTDVATVDNTGKITAVNMGDTVILLLPTMDLAVNAKSVCLRNQPPYLLQTTK